MEIIEKYNSYSDVNSGDIIVFKDGTSKTIKKVASDGHNVVFEDGVKRDLTIIEDKIEGIVYAESKIEEPAAEPISSFLEKVDIKIEEKPFKSLATSYKELNKLLYHGGDLEFYHLTAAPNAVEIVNRGYLYSRKTGEHFIRYDNKELNDITNSVMGTNRSYRLLSHARFYLNICNKATYAFRMNYKKYQTFGVIFALDFSAIWEAETNVLLSPVNAHDLYDNDFDWTRYNIRNKNNLKNYNAYDFDFRKTFERYDSYIDNPYLMAEILFYDKVPVSLFSHIYFETKEHMELFLKALPYNKRVLIENKCVVKEQLFWRNYD